MIQMLYSMCTLHVVVHIHVHSLTVDAGVKNNYYLMVNN